MKMYVPPNGFIGAGQQTQAAQLVEMGMPRNGNGARKRRAKAKTARAAPKRRARRATAKRASSRKLVKGSAAAKRRMAALRRMRRK